MKIIVVHKPKKDRHGLLQEGKKEVIELPEGSTWKVSEDKFMHCLEGQHGFDHFFLHEGYYDGWGGAVACSSPEESKEIIRALEVLSRYI